MCKTSLQVRIVEIQEKIDLLMIQKNEYVKNQNFEAATNVVKQVVSLKEELNALHK